MVAFESKVIDNSILSCKLRDSGTKNRMSSVDKLQELGPLNPTVHCMHETGS
jgi:hypothetical protein